jgi:signal transduction histidine kinase
MPADFEFLKEACQITGANWAAVVERESGRWQFCVSHQLVKLRKEALAGFLSTAIVDAWLCGAMSGGHARSRSVTLPGFEKSRLFVFPIPGSFNVIVVGAAKMDARLQGVWQMAVSFLTETRGLGDVTFLQSELLLPDLESDSPYDLTRALGRVLRAFTNLASAPGGWIAIRRGDHLDVQAQWNHPQAAGLSLSIEEGGILRRLSKSFKPIILESGQADWERIPRETVRGAPKAWACFPLVIGQRLIGVAALWRQKGFDADLVQSLEDLTAQVAPVVEIVITFASMADHMRRLAILNDFAITVSTAQNLDQIARRVFDLLSRAFGTERISLHLLSVDGRMLREYHNRAGQITPLAKEIVGHPFASFLKSGRTVRVADAASGGALTFQPDSASALVTPLKYRGRTIGALALESPRPNAFSLYDEHLLVVIASHLAGLVEYSRLREDAEGRARNLGLIHEVLQDVVGLTEKSEIAQITAGLLTQYFSYELASVFLADNEQNLTIGGLGGKAAPVVERALAKNKVPLSEGIVNHVFRTGESVLTNDVTQDRLYRPIAGWQPGSEMCVALRDGGQILGIVDVERESANAFTRNDLLDMESLAGILASIVSNADQYQRLQETIRQLRATQGELKDRIEAQRSAETRLLQAAKLAAVGEMAAGVAHELNNPLTTVTGFVELALEDLPPDAASRSDLELVLREARRARNVVRRLLDFARQTESNRARADLTEVLVDVIELTSHLLHTSGVELETNFPSGLPWVSMDRNQMKQVFLNLIHNALQAMPSGGVLVVSAATDSRDGRAWVKVTVRDTGTGILPENRERLFEPFFTTRADQGGSGLGLSVTYGIVTDHGGRIDVESRPGEGSTFVVWLPYG